jgi:hypothetical protein
VRSNDTPPSADSNWYGLLPPRIGRMPARPARPAPPGHGSRQSAAASAQHEAERVAGQAAGGGFSGIVAGMLQVRNVLKELRAGLHGVNGSLNEASATPAPDAFRCHQLPGELDITLVTYVAGVV